MIPEDLRYHKEHEWVRLDGQRVTLGISDFAQDALGDVVFVDLPKVATELTVNQEIGEVESTKATSSLLLAGKRKNRGSERRIAGPS